MLANGRRLRGRCGQTADDVDPNTKPRRHYWQSRTDCFGGIRAVSQARHCSQLHSAEWPVVAIMLLVIQMTQPDHERDQDIHKGVMEDGCPSEETNAPALDDEGLPNDETAIAEDRLGAEADGTQG